MGNKLAVSRHSLHDLDKNAKAADTNSRQQIKTKRDRANTSPLLNSLKNSLVRSSLGNINFRKKSDAKSPTSSNSHASSTLSINSGAGASLSKRSTILKPNNSTDKLSSLPHYLLPTNNQREARSLSPIKVRKPLKHVANLPPVSPLKTQILKKNSEENQNHQETESTKPKLAQKPLESPIARTNKTEISENLILNTSKVMALRPKTNPIYEDYLISRDVLGVGISGKVLICTHKQTQVKYALKTLRESVKAKREIDLQWRACQGCPYIVQIKDVYENSINNQKVLLVVMECMEGGELFAKISERTTPFTEQEVAKIMHQICFAVKHLHSMSIAHRDLKPENLLLTTNDETAIIKLTDFGFAKEVNHGLVTPCYTPYYVAPEVLGSERYDISCDIWSLGVIMYILCCGYPPFYSTHGQPISPGMKRRIKAGEFAFPEAEWSRVSKDAKDLIQGMLETIPERRSTINDIVRSNWISRYFAVPQTPLPSLEILREDRDNWSEVQQNMGKALDEMRINWDSKVNLLELKIVNNPLLQRRMNKKTKVTTSENCTKQMAPPPPPRKQAQNQDVEMLSREASVVSVDSVVVITPTNSRPASPDRKKF